MMIYTRTCYFDFLQLDMFGRHSVGYNILFGQATRRGHLSLHMNIKWVSSAPEMFE